MKTKNKDNKKIISNGYIDLDLIESANNILIIGNTTGFFGEFTLTSKNNATLDIKNSNISLISRIQFIINVLNSGKNITIIGNKDTIDYYNKFILFLKNSVKFNRANTKFKRINNDNEYIPFINELIKNNMKFDYIVQNPPYSGSLHLDFFKKGLELLSEDGKMTIIEPATWLIELRQNIADKKSSQMKKYITLKKRVETHVNKVIIENFNKEFNITNTVPFSITYIDKSKTFDNIEFIRFGEYNKVNSLNDCNLIGNIEIIKSIFKKIKQYDTIKNHITNEQLSDNNIYYIMYNEILRPLASSYFIRENYFYGETCYYKHYFGNYYMSFISPTLNISRNDISNKIHKAAARGGSVKGKVKLTDKSASCIYGTKNEIENYKYFISNNSLPLFINICMTIDQNNNSLPYVPWLVDKKYTDQEIYDKFDFTDEEIKLIEITIKKYERYSPWFKRYMCGKDSVSDKEVQKYIDNLNNA